MAKLTCPRRIAYLQSLQGWRRPAANMCFAGMPDETACPVSQPHVLLKRDGQCATAIGIRCAETSEMNVEAVDASFDRSVVRCLQGLDFPGPDRIQVDVGHALEQRGVVENGLQLEAAFPEAARAVVLPIRPSRERLIDTAHEPADAAESLSPPYDLLLISSLIDANEQDASLARLFCCDECGPVPETVGQLFDGFIEPTSIEGLAVVTVRGIASQRSAISPHELREEIDLAKRDYDLVIVDLSPATGISPCFEWGPLLDGVLLVVEAERTSAQARLGSSTKSIRCTRLGATHGPYAGTSATSTGVAPFGRTYDGAST